MTACDAAISLGGRPLRTAEGASFFIFYVLTERSVKSIDILAASVLL
jgi:hypothetical protein